MGDGEGEYVGGGGVDRRRRFSTAAAPRGSWGQ